MSEPQLPAGPYKGLARFDDSELDERFFFGRDRETELVAANLVASRLTVLYGPSGVGKSSLLRAGVVRRLRALVPAGGSSEGDGVLPVVVDQWRDDPLAAIAAAARTEAPASSAELADVLAERSAEVGGEIYLVLDQMEEYFVYHGRHRGDPLREALAEILARPALRVHILLGIRDDALAELDAFKGRVPGLFGNVLRLDHLDVDAARAAIVEPLAELEALGGPRMEAEEALVAAVVDQVASGRIERRLAGRGIVAGRAKGGRVEAPYLQLVMERLWEVERESGSSILRAATLAELGGSGRVVQQHLERALASLDAPERDLVARLFHQLVTPSGTKIAHAVGDLSRYAGESPERLEDVLHTLSNERVVRALPSRNGGGARYEIFHDVLAAAVLDWGARHEADRALAEEREAARRRHRRLAIIVGLALVGLAMMGLLTAYAFAKRSDAEEQTQRANEALLAAEAAQRTAEDAQADAESSAEEATTQKKVAQKSAAQAKSAEDSAQQASADAKRQAAIADVERDEARNQRSAAVAARTDAERHADAEAAAKRAAVASEQKAVRSRNAAIEDRRRAQAAAESEEQARLRAVAARQDAEAEALVAGSLSQQNIDPVQSVSLALQAARHARPPGLEEALREGLSAQRVRRIFPGPGGRPVTDVSTSPDGTLVVVAGEGEARVFDVETGKLVSRLRHGGVVNAAVFSPDGASVVTAGRDGVGRRWDARSGSQLARYPHGAAIRDVAFSPDGRLVATAAGQAARVWEAADGASIQRLPHPTSVAGVSFNADGTLLMTVAGDARLYQVGGWRLTSTLNQPGQITTARFAPVGSLVLTGGRDDLAMIWDSRDGTRRHELTGHSADILDVAWSPRGDLVAAASADNGARVWRADSGVPLTFLGGHSNQLTAIEFSPDGSSIATASLDGSARLWSGSSFSRSALLRGHGSPVDDVVFTRDGGSVITAGEDGSARGWRTRVDPALRVIGRHTSAGRAVVFASGGGVLVSAAVGDAVRVWKRDGTAVREIPQPASVVDLALSRDGSLLVTAGVDGIARTWRLADGAPLRSIEHGAALRSVALDPTSGRIVTAGVDGIARVWQPGSQRPLRVLRHGGVLAGVAVSPDGKFVATAGEDGDGRVWRSSNGALVGKLEGHEDGLTSIAYSPDGTRIVTASLDADARLWSTKTLRQLRVLRGHTAVVSDVTFSPDGRWIATAGPTAVGLWATRTTDRLESGTSELLLRGNLGRVRGVAFAPDSRHVAGIGDDGSVRTYLCELCGTTGELVRLAQRQLDRLRANLTPAERSNYLGG